MKQPVPLAALGSIAQVSMTEAERQEREQAEEAVARLDNLERVEDPNWPKTDDGRPLIRMPLLSDAVKRPSRSELRELEMRLDALANLEDGGSVHPVGSYAWMLAQFPVRGPKGRVGLPDRIVLRFFIWLDRVTTPHQSKDSS